MNVEVFETLLVTKFCPWDDHSHAVLDFPEAVFSNLGLTYLAHTHVHRTMGEPPNVMLAEDLNVALPLNYWVRDSRDIPKASGPHVAADSVQVDDQHVIWPVNTEHEIFTVDGHRHTPGAVFVLNHRQPLTKPAAREPFWIWTNTPGTDH